MYVDVFMYVHTYVYKAHQGLTNQGPGGPTRALPTRAHGGPQGPGLQGPTGVDKGPAHKGSWSPTTAWPKRAQGGHQGQA